MSKKQRFFAVALTVVFIAFVALSLSFMVVESGHDCIGEDCPVCGHIAFLNNVLRLTAIVAAILYAMLGISLWTDRLFSGSTTQYSCVTPVTLKIKLSN